MEYVLLMHNDADDCDDQEAWEPYIQRLSRWDVLKPQRHRWGHLRREARSESFNPGASDGLYLP